MNQSPLQEEIEKLLSAKTREEAALKRKEAAIKESIEAIVEYRSAAREFLEAAAGLEVADSGHVFVGANGVAYIIDIASDWFDYEDKANAVCVIPAIMHGKVEA
jgi:hypothetical protein